MSQPTVLVATPDPLPSLPPLAEITEESLAQWQRAVYTQAASVLAEAVAVSLRAMIEERQTRRHRVGAWLRSALS